MQFKLIVAFVEDRKTDAVMEAAREAGATGCTVITNARGEGIRESKTFFGLTLATQRDVVLLLVRLALLTVKKVLVLARKSCWNKLKVS